MRTLFILIAIFFVSKFSTFSQTEAEMDSSTRYRWAGRYAIQHEQFETAITCFDKALKFNPDFVDFVNSKGYVYFCRGYAKFQLEDYKSAVMDYSKAIELDYEKIKSLQNRSDSKKALDDYRGALQDLNNAVKLDTKNAESYLLRANIKYKMLDFRGALQDCNISIKLDPANSAAYLGRGYVKYDLNDINGACLDWSKAGELGHSQAYEMIQQYCN